MVRVDVVGCDEEASGRVFGLDNAVERDGGALRRRGRGLSVEGVGDGRGSCGGGRRRPDVAELESGRLGGRSVVHRVPSTLVGKVDPNACPNENE